MERPVSLMVFGVLNLVLAGLGLLGGCYGLFSPFIMKQTNPEMAKAYTGALLTVTIIIGVLGMGSKCLMAISGLGLVKGEAWGRRIGILWAWLSMALGLVFLVVNAAYVMPALSDAMQADLQRQQQGQQMPAGFGDMMSSMMIVMAIISGLIAALPYQITFLIMMNRKPIKDYFAGTAADQTATHPSEQAPAPWQS